MFSFYQISTFKTNMAKFTLLFLLLTLLSMATSTPTPTSFIKSSCSTTPYPTLCLESLSVYATIIQQDPHQLAETALSLSLNKTQTTKGFVTMCNTFKNLKQREYAALRDCAEEISDSVDRLSRSLKELKLCKINGQDFNWHISNVETWVSSALTDETTCGDGFGGKSLDGIIKASIRSRMANIAQFTSNALSLINQYAANHMEEIKH
ncbi:21 kDa protein [Lathyrus oleraceus]|uniref:21 kDa protein n=1 Tax=Pisum sativum TaxID=3888 RepID=UPI0021D36084|nr:21 kDa protein-like [Pisum sativum]